jgi:hypothetical protein
MFAIAETCRGNILYPYESGGKGGNFLLKIFDVMFSWTKSSRKELKRSGDVDKSFREYLDGYFNSYDFYPVCTRQVFARNDAYALWADFLKVADDLSYVTEEMIISPERFLGLESVDSEELSRRKKEAAQKGIQQAFGKPKR